MTSQSTKKQTEPIVRRKQPIIFWIFLVFAIPATIFVGLYSAGYRYAVETKTLTRTAAISLISSPKRATVVLNGNTQTETTPYIQTTPAGTYHILITKEGYQSWEKRMNIDSGKSIVFSDVVLFYQKPIVTALKNDTSTANFSFELGRIETTETPITSNSENAAVLVEKGFTKPEDLRLISGGQKLLLADKKNDRTYILDSLEDESYEHWIEGNLTDIEWIENNSFIYAVGTDLWLYQVSTKNTDLIVRGSQSITSLGAHHSGQYFYYTTPSGLYAVEYDSRDKRQIWKLLEEQNVFIDAVKNNGRIITVVDTQDINAIGNKKSVELYEQDTLLP